MVVVPLTEFIFSGATRVTSSTLLDKQMAPMCLDILA